MRPIKFRGESMGSDFVYGLLSQKVIRHSGRISWYWSREIVTDKAKKNVSEKV